MSFQAPADGVLLPPYRVLDLTGPEGVFCGKLLADYGADVIKIEPPDGAVAPDGSVYVADIDNHRIQKFTSVKLTLCTKI